MGECGGAGVDAYAGKMDADSLLAMANRGIPMSDGQIARFCGGITRENVFYVRKRAEEKIATALAMDPDAEPLIRDLLAG